MYKYDDGQLDIYSLIKPLEERLHPENRWIVRAKAIPWEELEDKFCDKLYSNIGAPAKPFRIMLGSLLIKQYLRISDAETVRQIQENPYLQYFIGLNEYTYDPVFTPSLFVSFRRRIDQRSMREIRRIVRQATKEKTEPGEEKELDE